MSTPTRIDTELFEAARVSDETHSRSAAQQIAHWARIGREFESSKHVSYHAVVRVLEGHDSYDGVSEPEQAVIRSEWDERITARLSDLNMTTEFMAAGDGWTEADDHGNAFTRTTSAG